MAMHGTQTSGALSEPHTAFAEDGFARDVLKGLQETPKRIPSCWFYDQEGSRLFQEITRTPEYYLTRCEQDILRSHARDIRRLVQADAFNLIELGAGDGLKTRILIEEFLDHGLDFTYMPIDISQSAIRDLTIALRTSYPGLQVVEQDDEYLRGLKRIGSRSSRRNLVLFLGSSIGNFTFGEQKFFLRDLRSALNPGDGVLIGFDLKKDVRLLHEAYNDVAGVTREFNFNLLSRINRELGGNFDRRRFRHYGAYSPLKGAMESFLVSLEDQEVEIAELRRKFRFLAFEAIHVESSHKFHDKEISALADFTEFEIVAQWKDMRGFFLNSFWRLPD